MPLPLARLLDEDIPKQEEDGEFEMSSVEESKSSLTSQDKNKFVALKHSSSFFGSNMEHR